jgi:hypothetical protein
MSDSDEQRGPVSPRPTLKLKAAVRPRAPAVATAPAPQAPPSKARNAAKTVDWADEHKQRMQADMDALNGVSSANQQPTIRHR